MGPLWEFLKKLAAPLVINRVWPMSVLCSILGLLEMEGTNFPMIVRSTMGVLLPRTQINSMLRDVTWRDVTWVTQHFLHVVPYLNYFETFGLYGFHAQDLTIAEQIFMLDEKIQIEKKKNSLFTEGRLWLRNLGKKILNVFHIPMKTSCLIMAEPLVLISACDSIRLN